MVCIYCDSETKVTNSRPQKRSNQIWRRRKCQGCGANFTSHEAIDLSSTLIVGSDAPKPFLEDLLYCDLLMALKDRPDSHTAAREALHTIIQELLKLPQRPLYKPTDISHVTGEILGRLDRRAYLRYHADHPSIQQGAP